MFSFAYLKKIPCIFNFNPIYYFQFKHRNVTIKVKCDYDAIMILKRYHRIAFKSYKELFKILWKQQQQTA